MPSRPAVGIEIAVDGPSIVYPGSHLTGKIILVRQRRTLEVESLQLQMYGNENARIRQRANSIKTSVMSQFFPLKDLNDGSGPFEFPFDAVVPDGILPTIKLGDEFFVNYVLEARVKVAHSADIVSALEIVVLPQPSSNCSNRIASPLIETPLGSFGGCMGDENLRIGISTPGNLSPGNSFELSYVIQNNSKKKIRKMSISVVEEVTLKIEGHTELINREICEKTVSAAALQTTFSYVSPFQATACSSGVVRYITDPEVAAEMQAKLNSPHAPAVSLEIPSSAHYDIRGSVINLRHFVVIRCHTGRSSLFGATPEFRFKLPLRHSLEQQGSTDSAFYPPTAPPSENSSLSSSSPTQTVSRRRRRSNDIVFAYAEVVPNSGSSVATNSKTTTAFRAAPVLLRTTF